MSPYLPKVATLEQAQAWLEHETGQQWPLARLIEETGIMPLVRLDYSQDVAPEIFAGRLEGFLAPMLFAGDTQRLAAGADDVVLTMTETPDGSLIQMAGMRCPLSELRFMADDLREISRVTGRMSASSGTSKPPPMVSSETAEPITWQKSARAIADECFDRDSASNCRDSMAGYARRVMDEMQKRGIHGPRGIIDNSNTIAREALQAEKWWKHKKK